MDVFDYFLSDYGFDLDYYYQIRLYDELGNKESGVVVCEERSKEIEMSVEERLDSLSVEQLELYGNETQMDINATMSNILEQTRIIDLGSAGDRLKELADVSKSTKKALALKGPFFTLTKMVGKYDKLESQLNILESNVETTVDKLNNTLGVLMLNTETLGTYVQALKEKEGELSDYIQALEERTVVDEKREQVVVRRLKDITTLRMMAEQNQLSSMLNLQENKETVKQVADIKTNIIPIIKMQLINKITAQVAANALKVKEDIYRYTNELMMQNVEDMDKNADVLIASRTSSAYDMDNFEKACEKMIHTIEKVAKNASVETAKNKEVVARMQETAARMNRMVSEHLG